MASESPYTLNNVRSLKNYGLYVIGNTYDPIYTKGVVQANPNILISGSCCTIDYSHAFDISDKIYFKKTFGKFGSGETFSISSSEYYDEQNNILTTLSGTCRITSTSNDDQVIFATIISGLTGITGYNYFSKENFNTTPQYTFTSTGGTIGYFLVNSMPNSSTVSFKTMGILGSAFGFEEYIELSGGTGNNYGKIKLYGITVLKDNTEIVYFDSGGQTQNFSTTATKADLYLRGYPSLITAPYNSNITGILTINNASTGDLLYCFENQSINQSELRKSKMAQIYATTYVACKSCYDLIYGNDLGTSISSVSPSFTNLIYLIIYDTTTVVALSGLPATFFLKSTTSVTLNSSKNVTVKIDLSHPSLQGYNLSFYTDAAYSIPISRKYYIFGIPGYNGSYAMLQDYPSAKTIYCKVTGLSTISFTITT